MPRRGPEVVVAGQVFEGKARVCNDGPFDKLSDRNPARIKSQRSCESGLAAAKVAPNLHNHLIAAVLPSG